MPLGFSMAVAFLEFKTPKPVLSHPQPHCLPSGSGDGLRLFQGRSAGQCGGPDRTRLRAGCGPRAPVCSLPSGQIVPFLFLVSAPPVPASVPLLKLFPWPRMPSAISGCLNPTRHSRPSSQVTSSVKPLWLSPCAPSILCTSFMTQITSCLC